VAEEPRDVGPADFEIVERKGIHPFYLETEIEEIILASAGWKVSSAVYDDHMRTICLEFSKGRRSIEVNLIKMETSWHPSESYFTYYITSDFARIPGMGRVKDYSKKYVSDFFSLMFTSDDGTGLDGMVGESFRQAENLTIYFLENRATSASISLDTSRP
jgi:hypothetical protein